MWKTTLSLGPFYPYDRDVGDDDNPESRSLVLEAWFEYVNMQNDLFMLTRLAEHIRPACSRQLAEAAACVRLAQGNLAFLEARELLIPPSQHTAMFQRCEGPYQDELMSMSENSSAEDRLKMSLQGLSDTVDLCLKASKMLGVSIKDSPAIESALYALAGAKLDSTISQESIEEIRALLVDAVIQLQASLNSKLANDCPTFGIANDLGAEGVSSTLDLYSMTCSAAAFHAVALMLADAKACHWDAIIAPQDPFKIHSIKCAFFATMLPCLSKVKAVHASVEFLRELACTPLAPKLENFHAVDVVKDMKAAMTSLRAFTSLKSLTISVSYNATIDSTLQMAPASLEHVRVKHINRAHVLKELLRACAHVKTLTLLSLDLVDHPRTTAAFLDALSDRDVSSTTTVHVDKLTVGATASPLLQRISEVLPSLPSMAFLLEEVSPGSQPSDGLSLNDICIALRTLPPGLREVELIGFGCKVTEEHREAVRFALYLLDLDKVIRVVFHN